MAERMRCSLRTSRFFFTSASSRLSCAMRLRIVRRSTSSFFSPGPLVPMPPPSLDIARPMPTRRDERYRSCASSTCSLPSPVMACCAKISRITIVRSMTLHESAFSKFFICTGVSSSSVTMPLAPVASRSSASSSSLPLPRYVPGCADSRFWIRRPTVSAPAVFTSSASSSRDSSALSAPLSGPSAATATNRTFSVSSPVSYITGHPPAQLSCTQSRPAAVPSPDTPGAGMLPSQCYCDSPSRFFKNLYSLVASMSSG